MGEVRENRSKPGWLRRSIEEARAWAALPRNRRWMDDVLSNIRPAQPQGDRRNG